MELGAAVTDTGGPVCDLGFDLNVELLPIHEGRRTELGNNDSKQNLEDNGESYDGSGQGGMHLGRPMAWEAQENKMMCQHLIPQMKILMMKYIEKDQLGS
ncbi:hypothetical protein NE237_029110 [Protea cynaroides]|uniref:Uncharacterized protein n=1 Tax=Protea cynaroides TaxID=273540 RepID=A0A9Q0JVY6_9MAGN|nr:hypothetical protein NE237_029110 [Protea cynaroides]